MKEIRVVRKTAITHFNNYTDKLHSPFIAKDKTTMRITPGKVLKLLVLCMLVFTALYTAPLLANVEPIQTHSIGQNPSERKSNVDPDLGLREVYSSDDSTMTKNMLYESSPLPDYEATTQGEIRTTQNSLSKQGEKPTMQGESLSAQEETPTTQGETLTTQTSLSKQGEKPTKQGETLSVQGETPTTQVETPTTQGESLVLLKNLDIDENDFQTRDRKPFQFDNAYKNPCWHEANGQLRCLPYFYIVGIRKAGTTHLWHNIISHPDVLNPGIKENQLLGFKQSDEYGLDEYIHYFDEVSKTLARLTEASSTPNNFVFGDGSTSPLYEKRHWKQYVGNEGLGEPKYVTFDLVHYILPDAKIIITFRDPIERLYSEYYFNNGKRLNQSNLSPNSFHDYAVYILEDFNACLKHNTVRGCVYSKRAADILVEIGIYYVYMEDLIRIFGREQIFVLRMEDINRTSTLAKLYKFLNLSSLPEEEMNALVDKRKNPTNRRLPEYAEQGPMLDATRKLLGDFYRPFNERMASLMNDEYFLFTDPERVPVNP